MAKHLTDITPKAGGDWRWRFLEMLAKSACVSTACVHARVSRFKAYNHRERFPKFRAKWDEALEIATEMLEVEARGRAFDRDDPASARLLMMLLQAHKPEKYKVAPKPQPPDPAALNAQKTIRVEFIDVDDTDTAEEAAP